MSMLAVYADMLLFSVTHLSENQNGIKHISVLANASDEISCADFIAILFWGVMSWFCSYFWCLIFAFSFFFAENDLDSYLFCNFGGCDCNHYCDVRENWIKRKKIDFGMKLEAFRFWPYACKWIYTACNIITYACNKARPQLCIM